MPLSIGLIGAGIMGKPMGFHLLRKGYPLFVYTRRRESAAPLEKMGALLCTSLSELAEKTDIIITVLPETKDVEMVLTGPDSILQAASPGTVVIDMSTISADTTKKIAQILAKNKIDMLDAPVSGGEQGAIAGTLSIMVGGKADIVEKVKPILQSLGKRIIHIGDHGAGQIAKSCNQIVVTETIVAVSEALQLAKASGVNPEKVREALLGGFASSRILEIHGQRMLDAHYQPGFKATLHLKDMVIAMKQAEAAGVSLPAATYATKNIDRLVAEGKGELDSAAIHLLVDQK